MHTHYCINVFSIIYLGIISLMQSVTEAKVLNNTFLPVLSDAATDTAAMFETVIVPLTCMYASL